VDSGVTILNDEEKKEFEEFIKAKRNAVWDGVERRSGIDRRRGVERRDDHDSAAQFRQDVDREYRAEIRWLRDEEARKDLELSALKTEIIRLQEWQKNQENTLAAAEIVVNAGTVFKYVVAVIIGLTGLIGGIALSMDALRAWLR
jgi:hypothetical protein